MSWRITISDLNQVIFSNINDKDPWSIDSYISSGGYEAWRNILNDQTKPYSAESIIEMIKEYSRFFLSLNLYAIIENNKHIYISRDIHHGTN